MTELERQGAQARAAARVLATASTVQKNQALEAIALALETCWDDVLAANAADMAAARAAGMRPAMLDRLLLDEGRIRGVAAGVRQVMALEDPVGRMVEMTTRPNGLQIGKKTVPLGVIGMIYEARPNVTVDAAVLCLKAGNAVILRGGKEAFATNNALTALMRGAIARAGLPEDAISLVQDTSRASATELMGLRGYLDVLIPRGGAGLIRACVAGATVPCIETGTGICHVYVDADADLDKALDIVENAKASRPSVCNAEEVLLVHSAVAAAFLPRLQRRLVTDRAAADKTPVELRLDRRAAAIIPGKPAGENDFDTEFLDYILAIRVVDSVDEAVAHIAAHSTGHSDAIITENAAAAEIFVAGVDSAAVYVNASTRFTDGGEFGLGCEMGISTQKLHARGPMGLDELSTYKYVVRGSGQIR